MEVAVWAYFIFFKKSSYYLKLHGSEVVSPAEHKLLNYVCFISFRDAERGVEKGKL